jgi:DNA-directed RNA polymerase subunit RPC12/RpoP
MAKNIKAIKCPHCGSIKITTLRPDYYKCDSCGTEFFLDSDDININHNYNYPRNNQDQYKAIRIVLFAVVGFIALMFVIGALSAIFPKSQRPIIQHSTSNTAEKKKRQNLSNGTTQATRYFWIKIIRHMLLSSVMSEPSENEWTKTRTIGLYWALRSQNG